MIALILSVAAMFMAVAGLIYAGHVAIVYHRFNEGIKEWANALDASTKDAIDRSARQILRELDESITQMNEMNENEEIVEPINNEENE